MEYSNHVVINLPIDRVIELFDSTENLFKWQPGLLKFEHLDGKPGEVGAKYLMVFEQGKRKIEMTETITAKDLPNVFNSIYETKGVWNEVRNKFSVVDQNTTKYETFSTFKFKGLMKFFSLVMPGAFKKQSQKYLDLFKAFAEKEG
jgi:hypothetical protein